MQAIPLIIAAVGTAASIRANNQANSERRNILNAQLDRDEDASKKSAELVLEEADNLTPGNRQDALAKSEQAISQQQQKDLQAGAGGEAAGEFTTSGDAGNVSSDFIKAKADRAISEGKRLTSIASELAKTRAPGMNSIEEGYGLAELSGNLANLGNTNQNYARAAGSDAAMVRPGKLGQYGQIASAIGGSMGGYGGSTTQVPAGGTWATSGGAGVQW